MITISNIIHFGGLFMKRSTLLMTAGLIGVFTLTSCSSNPYNTGSNPYAGEKAQVGIVTGAAVGAGLGALVSSKKDRGKGALIGAGAGAVLGGNTGYMMDKSDRNQQQYNRYERY